MKVSAPSTAVALVSVLVLNQYLTATGDCPNECSGHGYCKDTDFNKCICHNNWRGIHCHERSCPTWKPWSAVPERDDTAHTWAQEVECANMGVCNRKTGKCECARGFSGSACQIMDCPTGQHGLSCSGNGQCVPIVEATSAYDAISKSASAATSDVYSNWDAEMIFGCQCSPGYTGFDCSLRSCPRGDDPLTVAQRREVQVLNCQSDDDTPSFVLSYLGEFTSVLKPSSTPTDLQNALQALSNINRPVKVASTGATLCPTGGMSSAITFTHTPGDVLPLVATVISNAGNKLEINVAQAGDGAGQYGAKPVPYDGTAETLECSGRGMCDHNTGECKCFVDFESSNGAGGPGQAGDCGYYNPVVSKKAVTPFRHCPRPNTLPADHVVRNLAEYGPICNGHGKCNYDTSLVCYCEDGWSGRYCQHRACPTGRAWFDEFAGFNHVHSDGYECSNRGHCDVTRGVCKCDERFEGTACHRLKCPRIQHAGKQSTMECGGHGTCMSMSDLARYGKTATGAMTSFQYDAVWDSAMVTGCQCEFTDKHYEGVRTYSGADCSLKTCPVGSDPLNVKSGVWEQQHVKCRAVSGSFTLSFEGDTTAPIKFDSTAAETVVAIESLDRIGRVAVTLGTVCDVSKWPGKQSSCGSCSALVNIGGNGGSCKKYCENLGLTCVDAWDDTTDGQCSVNAPRLGCASSFSGSADGICECKATTCTGDLGFTVTLKSQYTPGVVSLMTMDSKALTPAASPKAGDNTVVRTVAATRVGYECSNRGVCNRATGECECYAGYCSSDGMGRKGVRMDCGYPSVQCKGGKI